MVGAGGLARRTFPFLRFSVLAHRPGTRNRDPRLAERARQRTLAMPGARQRPPAVRPLRRAASIARSHQRLRQFFLQQRSMKSRNRLEHRLQSRQTDCRKANLRRPGSYLFVLFCFMAWSPVWALTPESFGLRYPETTPTHFPPHPRRRPANPARFNFNSLCQITGQGAANTVENHHRDTFMTAALNAKRRRDRRDLTPSSCASLTHRFKAASAPGLVPNRTEPRKRDLSDGLRRNEQGAVAGVVGNWLA